MTIVNGRQQAPTIDGIRADHVARYILAKHWIDDGPRHKFLDIGCGCGYGASILGEVEGASVTAIDAQKDAIDYAKAHYAAKNIKFRVGNVETARLPKAEIVTAFEIIEHVEDPAALLARLAGLSDVLVGSVPNENVVPFDRARNPFHLRHFTPDELRALLSAAGYAETVIYSQAGKRGADAMIRDGEDGWTLVFAATKN